MRYKIFKMLHFFKTIVKPLKRLYYTKIVKLQAKSYIEPLWVNGKTRVNRNTMLGRNVSFNGLTIWGEGRVGIGNNFHSGVDVWIFTANHDYDHGNCIPYDNQRNVIKDVIIEDNVWIGSRVTILPGTRIEEGAIIQAAAVVVSDIPKYAVAGGNPAQVFKYRDIEHYEKLKMDCNFH